MSENESGNGRPQNNSLGGPCPICAKMSVERYRPFLAPKALWECRSANVVLPAAMPSRWSREDRSPDDDDERILG